MFQLRFTLIAILIVALSSCASIGRGTKAEKQQAIIDMKDRALTQLFKDKPYTRKHIESAEGYAVFSNANLNLFLIAAGTGYGLVKDIGSGELTYMNMAEGGVGLGLGVKDYRIVIIFHTQEAMSQFVDSGWAFGGNADATAKASDKGASIEGEAYYGDVTVYTFTQSGLALQATVKGTKFWKDKELN